MSVFAGQWFTTFGPMQLTQDGERVQGTYQCQRAECFIEGQVKDGTLSFRYQEPAIEGDGRFRLARHGRFNGQWRPDGDENWHPWHGFRQFDGIWESSFGLMRLIQEPERVFGFYEGAGSSSLEGRVDGDRLGFRYREPRAAGKGSFELSPDCFAFEGQWQQDGQASWRPWQGRRLLPNPGVRWLVVLEANWQNYLLEREYSFGSMLKEFFARVPGVEVRHRFFSNDAGLGLLCRDLLYIAEPTILVLAAHGTSEGLMTRAGPIGPQTLAENLRHADDLKLLHFSSCLLMDGGQAGAFHGALQNALRFPISGYAASVDWAASALIEFTYLDMILSKGLEPNDAAEQVRKLLAFSGDEPIEGSPYPPAHFRIWRPEES